MHNNTEQKNFLGRSMLEMLSVLAIIGVLSVMGVAMFTYLMNKHRFNVFLDDLMLIDNEFSTRVSVDSETDVDVITETETPDVVFKVRRVPDGGGADYGDDYIKAFHVSYNLCKSALGLEGTAYNIFEASDCTTQFVSCQAEDNTMAFYIRPQANSTQE